MIRLAVRVAARAGRARPGRAAGARAGRRRGGRAEPPTIVEYAVYGRRASCPQLPDLQRRRRGGAGRGPHHGDRRRLGRALAGSSTARSCSATGLTVRPPWEPPGDTAIDLVIDPGQAFGTGAHATTRLCLELLLELAPRGPFLDLGCGSGRAGDRRRQARAGVRSWPSTTTRPASAATIENAAVNGVELEVRRHDLAPARRRRRGDDHRQPARAAAAWLGERPCPNRDRPAGRLIASGLLEHEADGVAGAFAAVGLRERDGAHGGVGGAAPDRLKLSYRHPLGQAATANPGHAEGDGGRIMRGACLPHLANRDLQGGESSCSTRSRSV